MYTEVVGVVPLVSAFLTLVLLMFIGRALATSLSLSDNKFRQNMGNGLGAILS